MALIETLIGTVAPSITKTVLKLWAADHKAIVESGTSAVDILAKVIPDILARKEADRQFAAIGERAAQSLQFVFSTEGTQLFADEQQAVAELVAETLDRSQITVDLLIAKDLDPAVLATHLIKQVSDRLSGLPSARIQLFERVIREASESILDIAHDLPTYSERTNAELLRRNRVLVDTADRILDGLDRIRSQIDGSLESEDIRFETEYRRAAARNLNKMELFGIDLFGTAGTEYRAGAVVQSPDSYQGSSWERENDLDTLDSSKRRIENFPRATRSAQWCRSVCDPLEAFC
jgi:hypothetical protein